MRAPVAATHRHFPGLGWGTRLSSRCRSAQMLLAYRRRRRSSPMCISISRSRGFAPLRAMDASTPSTDFPRPILGRPARASNSVAQNSPRPSSSRRGSSRAGSRRRRIGRGLPVPSEVLCAVRTSASDPTSGHGCRLTISLPQRGTAATRAVHGAHCPSLLPDSLTTVVLGDRHLSNP